MRASDQVYENLRSQIIEWVLAPGQPLGEKETSERLGVSRTPVREALSRLVAEGLAVPIGRTVHVAPLSRGIIVELYEMREALEVAAAKLASRRRDPERFASLIAEFRPVELEDSSARSYFLAGQLDAAIDESAGNRYISTALDDLRGQMARLRHLAHSRPERLRKALEEHIQIAEAIWIGDESLAMGATSVHVRNSLANILSSLPLLEADE